MIELAYTLLSDGTSDRRLMPILEWILFQRLPEVEVSRALADFRHLPHPPTSLAQRIAKAAELFPRQILFVHRDAEGQRHQTRVEEIRRAAGEAFVGVTAVPTVCVVPVRMTEAWLLIDEQALRRAAGRPGARVPLQLPRIRDLESVRDPKQTLHDELERASGLRGRHLRRFEVRGSAQRVSELIEDFSPLRQLPAFRALEAEIDTVIVERSR